MKNFETALPENYREIYTVDATDKKLGLRLNLAAFAVMLAVVAAAAVAIRPRLSDYSISSSLLTLGAMFAYIVLHELTHGAAYKLLTRHKLTYGITLTVAYCGVPDIFVYRRTALIALLAPFAVFTVVFALPMMLLPVGMDRFFCALLLGIHLGGCAGDLWDTWLFMTRLRDPAILMNDTGPKQTFYAPEN